MLRRWSQDRRSAPALFMTMWLPCWVGSLLMGPCPGLGMSEKKDAVGLLLLECPWLLEIIVTQKECLAYIQDFKCWITKGGHRRKERAGRSGKRFFCRGGGGGGGFFRQPLLKTQKRSVYSQIGSGTGSCQQELPQKQLLGDLFVSIGGNGKCGRGPARGHFQSTALR